MYLSISIFKTVISSFTNIQQAAHIHRLSDYLTFSLIHICIYVLVCYLIIIYNIHTYIYIYIHAYIYIYIYIYICIYIYIFIYIYVKRNLSLLAQILQISQYTCTLLGLDMHQLTISFYYDPKLIRKLCLPNSPHLHCFTYLNFYGEKKQKTET